ncbi:MAG: hypothetical protein GY756_18965, partial [bacterium]|nr:hypothetical protein [bacterium]
KVINIDPAETVIQGVIYYQMTAIFDTTHPDIRSGMTVNLDILAEKKENVITISPQAVNYKDNKAFVRVLENEAPKEKEVETGLEGNKYVEIQSGITEEEVIILFEK